MSIVDEVPGYLQVFSDGSVKRFTPEAALTFPTPPVGFKFKDVTIDTTKPITARIFIPTESSTENFPLLVYFHGGGFCIGSTTWSGYHYFLGDLSARARCVVVSVDYRLAPESRLPIAYEDGYAALEWIAKGTDPWLGQTDLSRVLLSGDSAGGNIAHHVAIRATLKKVQGVDIRGLMPIHPYFGSEKRTQKELEDGSAGPVSSNDLFWGLSIPVGSNRDYFGCNFENAEMSDEEWSRFPRHVVVFVAGLDFLKERGESYFEFMKKKGVGDVRLVVAEGEQHVYHVFEPGSEATRLLQRQMGDVIMGSNPGLRRLAI